MLLVTLFSNAQVKKKNTFDSPVTLPDTSKSLFQSVNSQDSSKESFTLRQCIDYALVHQPALNRSIVNVSIARETNKVNLAGWLPQVNASGNLLHYIQLPTNSSVLNTGSNIGATSTAVSTKGQSIANTFIPGATASQALFSPSLLLAAKSAPLFVTQAQQITDSTKIYLVTAVSKSFYNVLLTLEQINVLKEDTTRLGQNLRDTYHQYKGGIVDETDYDEADITLNNSKAQLRQATLNVSPQYANLKQLMGYPPAQDFNVKFDTLEMARNIHIDTLEQLQYEKRIEYKQNATDKQLQTQLIKYYKYAFMPTLSAFYNYNLAFENNKMSDIFSNSYPNSLVGLSFSIPIFTGFARTHNIRKAQLQEKLLDLDQVDLKSQIFKEYATSMANYKGNYYNLQLLQKNVNTAKRVYFIVNLQYKQGIVAYLNVITAESNLISSEISYINALFQVLSNKVDLQKSMGNITY